MDIRFVKRDVLKEKPDQKHLGFGKYMTDYMFVMDWTKEDGWKDARIVPEGPISLEPACVTLHYAQETFEGMKAYRIIKTAADKCNITGNISCHSLRKTFGFFAWK